jgi:hypothetical protein
MSAATATAMPLVTFNNDDCARLFNANMNYAMPSDGPRIFNVNGQRYVKKGTEKVYEMGHKETVWQKYGLEGDSGPQSQETNWLNFRQSFGIFTVGLEFVLPYKDGEPLKFSYNVGRGHYAGFFECSSPDHEIKISDSGNVVVVEKASGQAVWVIYW